MPQEEAGEIRLENASQQSTRLMATGWPMRRLRVNVEIVVGKGRAFKIQVEFPRFSVISITR